MKTKKNVIHVDDQDVIRVNDQDEVVFYDKNTIAEDPFREWDYQIDSIMRELERG